MGTHHASKRRGDFFQRGVKGNRGGKAEKAVTKERERDNKNKQKKADRKTGREEKR